MHSELVQKVPKISHSNAIKCRSNAAFSKNEIMPIKVIKGQEKCRQSKWKNVES